MDGVTQERPYHALKAIPDVNDLIVSRVADGKSIKAIAEPLGVSTTAVLKRAEQHPEYRPALRTSLRLLLQRREADLESAESNVTVTRADRLLGHARWLAERCDPESFGQRTHVTVEHVDFAEELRKAREARERVIEHAHEPQDVAYDEHVRTQQALPK